MSKVSGMAVSHLVSIKRLNAKFSLQTTTVKPVFSSHSWEMAV